MSLSCSDPIWSVFLPLLHSMRPIWPRLQRHGPVLGFQKAWEHDSAGTSAGKPSQPIDYPTHCSVCPRLRGRGSEESMELWWKVSSQSSLREPGWTVCELASSGRQRACKPCKPLKLLPSAWDLHCPLQIISSWAQQTFSDRDIRCISLFRKRTLMIRLDLSSTGYSAIPAATAKSAVQLLGPSRCPSRCPTSLAAAWKPALGLCPSAKSAVQAG